MMYWKNNKFNGFLIRIKCHFSQCMFAFYNIKHF